MYTSTHYEFEDEAAIRRLIDRHGLAALVSVGANGLEATHCPVLFDPAAPERMIGHLARPNQHWRRISDGDRILTIFRGPDAYISPKVYTEEPDVPTWNYIAAHVHGTWRKADDQKERSRILDLTVRHFEESLGMGWQMDVLNQDLINSLTRGTVGFVLTDLRIEAADKSSQDKCPIDRSAVENFLKV